MITLGYYYEKTQKKEKIYQGPVSSFDEKLFQGLKNDVENSLINRKSKNKEGDIRIHQNISHDENQFVRGHVLPHYIIIGEMKCGTSAVAKMLNDIYPNVKAKRGESHYFNNERFYPRGIEWYKNSLPEMTHPNDLVAEVTPGYFRNPYSAERILRDTPKSKFILVACDPVRRTGSDFVHCVTTGLHDDIPRGYRFPIDHLLIFKNSSLNEGHRIIQSSVYAKNMERWLQLFPKNQILVVNGDDLYTSPLSIAKKVEKFLALPPLANDQTFIKQPGSNLYQWKGYSGRLSPRMYDKGRKHPETKDKVALLASLLKKYFIPWNERFFQQIGEKFDWKMDVV